MTISSAPAATPTSSKLFGVSSCIVTALAILFVILGAYELVIGSIIVYVFSSTRMFSSANIAIVLIVVCDCVIYFLLAFRIKRQHWLTSLALLAVAWLVLPFPLRFLINTATARVRIDGYAMGPTLPNESYILADRLAYQRNDPARGDIVLFNFPLDPKQDMIKRVIGLPGETISVKDGTVTINGTPLEEPYITDPPLYNGTWVVPEGQFFVLGDNRNDSRDSHQWGFLPRENIVAKAVWIYYPFASFGEIIDPEYSSQFRQSGVVSSRSAMVRR